MVSVSWSPGRPLFFCAQPSTFAAARFPHALGAQITAHFPWPSWYFPHQTGRSLSRPLITLASWIINMALPAARLTDFHVCPLFNGPQPHIGGPVVVGCPTVLIGGLPAARVTDVCVCAGPP